jgi:lipoprotein-anchoring transpeptidase ErfK/SrfK
VVAPRKQTRPRRGAARWFLLGGGFTVVAVAAAGGFVVLRDSPSATNVTNVPKDDTAQMHVLPGPGTTNVPLETSVVVHVTDAHLDAVAATGLDGQPLTGVTEPDGLTWRSTGRLTPQTTFAVTADATSTAGHQLHQVVTFTTVPPTAVLSPTITPSDGLAVGVGQPIVVHFDRPVADQQAVLQRLAVQMSTPVTGGWHWFNNQEIHFRPQAYWPTGEQVTVTANLAGYDNGNGVWGDGSHTTHFTVGDARTSTVDLAAHTMTVQQNGQVVKTLPISAGRDKYPTMTGTHIALYRQSDVLMDSATVGIPRDSPDGYYEHVFFDVAITDGGEFVHAAPWSTGSQGRSNVSHGCVNLSNADAEWFFNFSRMGDVINVVNGPRGPELGDHGVMDWNTPWDQWTVR